MYFYEIHRLSKGKSFHSSYCEKDKDSYNYQISIASTSPDAMVDKEEDFVLMNLVVIAFGNFIGKE
jgi:hypothetical protein